MWVDFNILKGLTLTSVEKINDVYGDEIIFRTTCGRRFRMFHNQNCCEYVRIEDINGDLNDLVGYPITLAEESSNSVERPFDSATWTFYRLATVKGYVDIRWLGESNGYYSEAVDFIEL